MKLARGNYDPNETPAELAGRLEKVKAFVDACQSPEEQRPVTAQPVGQKFTVESRGLAHAAGGEEVSDNFFETDPGCYRRLPTCRD